MHTHAHTQVCNELSLGQERNNALREMRSSVGFTAESTQHSTTNTRGRPMAIKDHDQETRKTTPADRIHQWMLKLVARSQKIKRIFTVLKYVLQDIFNYKGIVTLLCRNAADTD